MSNQRLIVIGSGLAGYYCAQEWRKQGGKGELTIITKDDGSFYSKPMLSNALAKQKNPSELVTTPTEKMIEKLDARILTHTSVERIDPAAKVIYYNGEAQHYDHLVLAMGATPITPPMTGDADQLWQVNHLCDYEKLHPELTTPKNILIIGQGLIGCEFTNDFLSGGHTISTVSLDPAPLTGLVPPEIGTALQKVFSELGVTSHFNEHAKHIEKTAQGYKLTTAEGTEIEADLVISAIGITPSIALAKDTGLETKRGIVVNEYMQSSDANIYAIGDCMELDGQVQQYIAPLLLCARQLGKNLADPENKQPVSIPTTPVTVKTPAYPIVVATPKESANWTVSAESDSLIARAVNTAGTLSGFAIGNATPSLRTQLTKELNHVNH